MAPRQQLAYSRALKILFNECIVRGLRKEVKAMLDKGELTVDQWHQPVDATVLPPLPKKGRPLILGNLEKFMMEGH